MRFCLPVLLIVAIAVTGCANFKNPLVVAPPLPWTTSTYLDENQKLTSRAESLREVSPFVTGSDLGLFHVQITDNAISSQPASSDRTGSGQPRRETTAPRSGFSYAIVRAPDRLAPHATRLTPALYVNLLNKYVQDRRTQIDKLCLDYFSTLDDVAGSSRFAQTEVNSIGDFAAVVMGITGSPAEHLAILAGAQALTNDSFDATSAMLLLSPPPSVVFELVKSKQRALTAAAPAEGFAEFRPAEQFVSRYAATCMPVGIRAIVTETITSEAADANPDSPRQNAALVLVRAALNEGLPEASKVGDLTVRDAAFVVWYLGLPACAPTCATGSEQEHIQKSLATPIWNAMQSASDRAKLRTLISQAVANTPAITTQRGELETQFQQGKANAQVADLQAALTLANTEKARLQGEKQRLETDARTAAETQGGLRERLEQAQRVRDRACAALRAVAVPPASADGSLPAATPPESPPPPVEGCPVTP